MGMGITWLAPGFFESNGIEMAAKYLLILNGILCVLDALWTSFNLGWVLSLPGLISLGIWIILYLLMAVFFYQVLKQRRAHKS